MTHRRKAAQVAVAGVVSITLGAGLGLAAGLGLGADHLTSFDSASHVPTPSICTLQAVADAAIDQAKGNRNFGSASSLIVRAATGKAARSLVRFDLAGCAIPPGATVQVATLKLFMWAAPGRSRTDQAFRVTTDWSEGSVTFVTQPGVASSATSSTSTGTTSNVTLAWDVTPDVQAFVNGAETNFGWRVNDQSEGGRRLEQRFRSREFSNSAQRPSLVVNFTSSGKDQGRKSPKPEPKPDSSIHPPGPGLAGEPPAPSSKGQP